MALKFGMSIIVRGPDCGRETFVAMAAKAEATGLDALWTSDHLVIPALKTSRYPGRADGSMPETWLHSYYQPFSVLNYMAALTRTVRLGMSVLIVPMRNPIEVAAQIAELDQLSGGRVNFGIGVGWYREEFEALGYDFTTRGKRTDEGLDAMKALWAEKATTFAGEFYRFDDTRLSPKTDPVATPADLRRRQFAGRHAPHRPPRRRLASDEDDSRTDRPRRGRR